MNRPTLLHRLLAPLGLVAALSTLPVLAQTAPPPPDYSAAERLLLMGNQLQQVRPPTTLTYRFQRSTGRRLAGSAGCRPGPRTAVRACRCAATGAFLTGERRVTLPDLEQAQGNPVTLYFLEHDIREMQRLTKGQAHYFRKRIRMALYQGAQVRDVRFSYRGQTLAGQEIVIQPYLDDPNRARFEQLARKQYVFLLSIAVPGTVVSIRTTAGPEGGSSPLIEEALWIDGATRPAYTPAASAALTRTPPVRP